MQGLTSAEVEQRIAEGKTNHITVKATSTWSILRKNIFTVFNFVNIILAILIFTTGTFKNALFAGVAIINTAIAIFNEVRAKKIVDKLSIITTKKQTVIRDGKEIEIDNEDIVLGDTIKYTLGDQIVVDSVVLTGNVEVNESFITGESDNIAKKAEDKLISGSFVVSGTCYARVITVGNDNFTSEILKNAKSIKQKQSKLFHILNKIVQYISYSLVPIGLLLFFHQLSIGADYSTAITSTVAALVSMIPEGLMLLTSSVLALSTIRLSRKKVLVQDLYSIETLARVDTICLDKTGTITTGQMTVSDVVPVGKHTKKEMAKVVSAIIANLKDNNATSAALAKEFGNDSKLIATEKIPFSSDRKYSGIKIKKDTYLMGALEFVTTDRKYFKHEQELSKEYRVITVMHNKDVLGFILLSDTLRKNAHKLIDYFNNNDVKVKVISGDNLGTITKVASQVNLDTSRAIDLSTVPSGTNYKQLVEEYDIFARVKPAQKKRLIVALKNNKHIVAMTGDGVNDVLALKEADCGISIGEGADAARRVSKLILLGSDFSTVPDIINEGRQTINNIERSASLFLSKTIFASILSVTFIFLTYTYPFTPIAMAFINGIIIGIPSFILALETNHERIKNNFVKNILHNSLPSGLTTVCCVITLVILAAGNNLPFGEITTISAVVVTFIGMILIAKISFPFNKLRLALIQTLIILSVLAFIIPFARNFFSFQFLSDSGTYILLSLIGIAIILFSSFSYLTRRFIKC